MPSYSKVSKDRLSTAHPMLQKLFNQVILYYDCTIVEGFRDQATQDKAFNEGKSKLKWPNSKHNSQPSQAIDAAPFVNGKICWDKNQVLQFAGFVLGIAAVMCIPIRWGGDWDNDHDLADNKFNDLVHFELKLD